MEFQKVHLDFTPSYDEGGASDLNAEYQPPHCCHPCGGAAFAPDTITSAQQRPLANLGSASLPPCLTSPARKVQLRLRALAGFEVCQCVLLPLLVGKGSSKRSSVSTTKSFGASRAQCCSKCPPRCILLTRRLAPLIVMEVELATRFINISSGGGRSLQAFAKY